MADEKQDAAHWWLDVVKTLGMPTAFLGIVIYMIWAAGKWTSAEVVMPLVKRQMEFIDTATKTLEDTRLAAAAVQQVQIHGAVNLKRIDDQTLQIGIDTKRIIEMVKDIDYYLKTNEKPKPGGNE